MFIDLLIPKVRRSIGRLGLVMILIHLTASSLQAQWLECRQLSWLADKLMDGISRQQLVLDLKKAERTVMHAQTADDRVACLKWLADLHRDLGSYRAEQLYKQAVRKAPENPEVLEAIATYYRTYRGTKGLFAESEAYYLRAELAVKTALAAMNEGEVPEYLDRLQERIVRGRIDLNKREGFGLAIPRRPGQTFGLYVGSTLDDGRFPVAHNDLATPANTLLNLDLNFDTREMLRQQDLRRHRTRLRFRSGQRPYWDLAWSTTEGPNVIPSRTLPVTFADLEVEEFELAVEDTVNLAPVADLLWRTELHHGTFDVEGPGEEVFDRVVVSTTWTRSFGRIKADLHLLGTFASIDLRPGGRDRDWLAAANLRFLHFRPRKAEKPSADQGGEENQEPASDPQEDKSEERPIDPRGYEYRFGYVTHTREFGEEFELVLETFFAGLRFTELVARTDLEILPNYFRSIVRGRPEEDSSNLEFNLLLTHRLIDRVNDLERRQASQPLGLAQWAVNLRFFEVVAFDTLDDFESQGLVLSSFVEIFSGPANRSTLILEAAYEIREYRHIDKRQHLARFGIRLGF